MAFTGLGGREYYTDAVALTSGTTNCINRGRIKGIMTGTATSVTVHFPSSSIALTPTAGQILPFSPQGVTMASGTAYALY